MMIDHIILDMGNVLLAFDPVQSVRDVLGDHPCIRQVVDATTRSPEWKALDQGVISEDEAVASMIQSAPSLQDEIRCFMEHWDEYLQPVPGMEQVVTELKHAGYSLHLLSNAGLRFHRYSLRFPVFSMLDTIHISAEMKLLKPDRQIYQKLLQELALTPENCLFIDDMEENVSGAQAVGIHSIRFVSCEDLRPKLAALFHD